MNGRKKEFIFSTTKIASKIKFPYLKKLLYICTMKLSKEIQDKLSRKVNRQLEMESGRISYNRVHKSKKMYNRKRLKKVSIND